MQPGMIGSRVPRGDGKSPVWFIRTPRGPAGLTLDDDQILDIDPIELEDYYFPDAANWTERAAAFVKHTRHDALPAYVDHWWGRGGRTGRAALVDGKLTTTPYQGPTFYLATRREVGQPGWSYLRHHRLPKRGLPLFVAARIVERLADLCRIAHAKGVAHGGIAVAALLVRPNGRPILEEWSGRAWRARGNVGFDFEGLWSIQRELRLDPAAASSADDVFRLGCLLSTLITGAPPFERGDGKITYRAPSARASVPADIDSIVGAACDPARGFKASAAFLQEGLQELLAFAWPSTERAREALRQGDFAGFAELVASVDELTIPGIEGVARRAVNRFVARALERGQPAPMFTELLLSVCPGARGSVRDLARGGERSSLIRSAALSLLTQVDDAEALPLLAAFIQERCSPIGMVGWSARPEVVREDGAACTHPWSSLTGEPEEGSEAMRRVCPACGPVLLLEAWLGEQYRSRKHQPLGEDPPVIWLESEIEGEETSRVPLMPGLPCWISSKPRCAVFIDGLDPAYHTSLLNVGRYELSCALAVDAAFSDYGLARTAVINASGGEREEPPSPLRIGPVELVVIGPGRIKIVADAGVRVTLRDTWAGAALNSSGEAS